MTINEAIIREFEHTYRKTFPDDLKKYLLMKYGQEPFLYEFSEQDLYTNIRNDIRDYEIGNLDVAAKSLSKQWQEEHEYLQSLYIEKCREAHELEEYINKLERIISEDGLKPSEIDDR